MACPVHPVEMVTRDDPELEVTMVTPVALATEVPLVMLELMERQGNLDLMELTVCPVGLGILVLPAMPLMEILELPETGVSPVMLVLTEHQDLMEPLETLDDLVTVVTPETLVLLENPPLEPLETMELPVLQGLRALWEPLEGTGMQDDLVAPE